MYAAYVSVKSLVQMSTKYPSPTSKVFIRLSILFISSSFHMETYSILLRTVFFLGKWKDELPSFFAAFATLIEVRLLILCLVVRGERELNPPPLFLIHCEKPLFTGSCAILLSFPPLWGAQTRAHCINIPQICIFFCIKCMNINTLCMRIQSPNSGKLASNSAFCVAFLRFLWYETSVVRMSACPKLSFINLLSTPPSSRMEATVFRILCGERYSTPTAEHTRANRFLTPAAFIRLT